MEVKKEELVIMPFATQTGLELANAAVEEYHGLVDDLLLEVGVSMLAAKPKAGKSTLLRQLAVAIAEGTDFFGKPTLAGDVLYLSLEGPKGAVQQHLKKLGITQNRGTVHVVHEPMPHRGELGLRRLEATIKTFPKLRLVIVDPVGKLLRLADSDSYDEVCLGIEMLEQQIAKQFELHVMFSAHAKKRQTDDAGDSPIGSTGFRGGTDTNIFLHKQGTQRIISTEQRWGIALEPTVLLFDEDRQAMSLGNSVEEEENAATQSRERSTAQRIEKEIWDTLCVEPNITQGELLKAVTGRNTAKLKALQEMVASGKVVPERDGKATRYRAVVPTERQAA
jgi:AAA domain